MQPFFFAYLFPWCIYVYRKLGVFFFKEKKPSCYLQFIIFLLSFLQFRLKRNIHQIVSKKAWNLFSKHDINQIDFFRIFLEKIVLCFYSNTTKKRFHMLARSAKHMTFPVLPLLSKKFTEYRMQKIFEIYPAYKNERTYMHAPRKSKAF